MRTVYIVLSSPVAVQTDFELRPEFVFVGQRHFSAVLRFRIANLSSFRPFPKGSVWPLFCGERCFWLRNRYLRLIFDPRLADFAAFVPSPMLASQVAQEFVFELSPGFLSVQDFRRFKQNLGADLRQLALQYSDVRQTRGDQLFQFRVRFVAKPRSVTTGETARRDFN